LERLGWSVKAKETDKRNRQQTKETAQTPPIAEKFTVQKTGKHSSRSAWRR